MRAHHRTVEIWHSVLRALSESRRLSQSSDTAITTSSVLCASYPWVPTSWLNRLSWVYTTQPGSASLMEGRVWMKPATAERSLVPYLISPLA